MLRWARIKCLRTKKFVVYISYNNTKFYQMKIIEKTIENLEKGAEIVIFWILWILLIIALVIGFYYLENKWLD